MVRFVNVSLDVASSVLFSIQLAYASTTSSRNGAGGKRGRHLCFRLSGLRAAYSETAALRGLLFHKPKRQRQDLCR